MASLKADYSNRCGRYLRLANSFSVQEAAALWCDADPSSDLLFLQNVATCYAIKEKLIWQAIYEEKLPISRDGTGEKQPWKDVAKDRMKIMRADLIAWFEGLSTGDKPAFLFEDGGFEDLPDVGAVAELNSLRALAVMAWILSENKPALQVGAGSGRPRPNSKAIGEAVAAAAKRLWGDDARFDSFHKKLGTALKTLEDDDKGGVALPWSKK